MKGIDLNCDLGESFGAYTIGMDAGVMDYITSANVACGWHGGDPAVMARTVAMAQEKGVRVGAHPGFPDLMGFGRREMKLQKGEGYAYTLYQMGALWAFCKAQNIPMQHMKAHGTFYNMACKDIGLATEICKASRDFSREIVILAPLGSQFHVAAEELGLPFAGEFFADRAYNPDGSLVTRGLPGAMVEDAGVAAARVLKMAQEGTVTCMDGTELAIGCVSVCVHGDNAHAVDFVKLLRNSLEEAGIPVRPLGGLI